MQDDVLPTRRAPVRFDAAQDPGYPSLLARRRLLKLAALSTVGGALGLELIGCPGPSTGGTVGPAPDPEWVPWREPQRLAGAPMPRRATPSAYVIGGGPVAVTFKDGAKADLVVAAVVTPNPGADVLAGINAGAVWHATMISEHAAQVPASTLGDAKALETFEEGLRQALVPSITGGTLDSVSVAKAHAEDAPPPAPAPARAPSAPPAPPPAPADGAPSAAAPSAPAPRPAPVAAVPQGAPTVGAGQLWTPCRRPGCTTCGAR